MHHGSNTITITDHVGPYAAKVPEIAKRIGIGERLCWSLVSSEVIPSCKIGNVRLVRIADADAYIDRLVEEQRGSKTADKAA
jgi:hypothetical protein